MGYGRLRLTPARSWNGIGATRDAASLSCYTARAYTALLEAPASEVVASQQVHSVFEGIRALQNVLTDPERTSVRLVLLPERMALLETERAYTYRSLFGMSVEALFLNRLLPDRVCDPFFGAWRQDQFRYRRELLEQFRPLSVFEVPLVAREVIGLEALAALPDATYGERDPSLRLGREQPLETHAEDGRYVLSLRVPGVSAGGVQIERAGDALRVRLGRYRRTLPLPQYLVGLSPPWAQLDGQRLVIVFELSRVPLPEARRPAPETLETGDVLTETTGRVSCVDSSRPNRHSGGACGHADHRHRFWHYQLQRGREPLGTGGTHPTRGRQYDFAFHYLHHPRG